MEITIKGEPKEIAALVLAIQERQIFVDEGGEQLEAYMKAMFGSVQPESL